MLRGKSDLLHHPSSRLPENLEAAWSRYSLSMPDASPTPGGEPPASEVTPSAARRHTPVRAGLARPHDCPRPLRRRILAALPLVHGLSTAQLDALDDRMLSFSWAAGDTLYAAGDSADHLFIVASGQVKLFHTGKDGRRRIVDVVGPGEMFAGEALVEQTYPDTAEALSITCALRLDVAEFRSTLVEHPDLALRVLDNTTRQLARAREEAARHAGQSTAGRVAETLLRLADKFGRPDDETGGTLINLPLTREDLAEMTGTTPESVSRVMSRLRADGLVATGRRWTAVLDRPGLKDRSADN